MSGDDVSESSDCQDSTPHVADHVVEDPEVRRSKTLKRLGYVGIAVAMITICTTLGSFLYYKELWTTLLGQLFSGIFLISAGILSIVSGTNVEDQCHITTTCVLTVAVSCIEVCNIVLCALNFEMEKILLLALLIGFSALKGVLGLAMLIQSSRFVLRDYNCCRKDEMLTHLI